MFKPSIKNIYVKEVESKGFWNLRPEVIHTTFWQKIFSAEVLFTPKIRGGRELCVSTLC